MSPPSQTLDERLPTPKLDDRRFQDLVDEAKRRVQQRCPEWTDHNVSDPGVTLIETFAWMTDQLLYRLNRVPDLNYVKFLELLGVTLFPPTAARVDLTFRLANAQATELPIEAETQVSTQRKGSGEQIVFATLRALSILPCSRQALASVDHTGVVRNHDDAEPIVCFSDRPRPGDGFLVGLDKAVPSCTVRLFLPCRKGAGGGIAPDNPPLVWDARVGEDAGAVCLWNPRTREELRRFAGGPVVHCLAFSPDGHMLAYGGDGTVWLRDAHEPPDEPGRSLEGHKGPVRAVAFGAAGSKLASAGDDGAVWLWDVDKPERPGRRLSGHEGPVFSVAFDPKAQILASAGADGTLRLWDVEKGESTGVWDVHEPRDPATGGPHRRCVLGVAFIRDGRKLAAAGDDGTLWLWSLRAGAARSEQAQEERSLAGHRGPVFGAAFSRDGETLATAGHDGTARLWDVDPPVGHEQLVLAGEEASDDGDAEADRPRLFTGHQGPVYEPAFSPDGKTLATVGSDWTARLWSVGTGEQLRRPLTDRCPVHGVAFNPRGDMVATAAVDGGWEPCEVESDGTKGLNEAASVVLHVPGHTYAKVGVTTAGWLRCRVRAVEHGQAQYDKSPVIEGDVGAETIGGTVSATNAEIVHDEILGVSEGVGGQRFPLARRPVVPLPGKEEHVLEVLVGEQPEEWTEVPSFAGAKKDDRWFVLDHVLGDVALGPTVREWDASTGTETYRQYGAVPPKGAVLRLRRYMTGGGRRGNVSERTLTVLRSPKANVASVENRRPASGGVDGEDIENAKLRGPIMLRTANRAVTPEDYEQLAREAAPELARVECIPATDDAHAGEARVLVIPNVESDDAELRFEQLVPTVETINRIKDYLDRRRVIGVRILVGPPRYRGITIAAKLVARTQFDAGDVKERALEALYRAFSPISGGREGKGWEFGRPVLEGDVYAVLQSVCGIERVDDCRLFEANPLTGERTPLGSDPATAGEPPHALEVPVSPDATVFSYRHYLIVEGQ